MNSIELADALADFAPLVALIEETGERVSLTEDGQPAYELLAGAELAGMEHWAERADKAPIPHPEAAPERPAGLDERARQGRQGYMDPKQAAAFKEFLARQPPVGDEVGARSPVDEQVD
ncbi:type II toxin-antitoxin system Phd/YefM family antitoxin [Streptomyces sp. NPDC052114]|uniref:type II toxin-antitoxin system Phd/YefM family antitoxin n=1 Tax=unclassified Streptomyces TaxID=2593676 RepID=UPI0034153E0D